MTRDSFDVSCQMLLINDHQHHQVCDQGDPNRPTSLLTLETTTWDISTLLERGHFYIAKVGSASEKFTQRRSAPFAGEEKKNGTCPAEFQGLGRHSISPRLIW